VALVDEGIALGMPAWGEGLGPECRSVRDVLAPVHTPPAPALLSPSLKSSGASQRLLDDQTVLSSVQMLALGAGPICQGSRRFIPLPDSMGPLDTARNSVIYSRIKMLARGPQLDFRFPTWGGRRPGAGRKPRDPRRPATPHTARPAHRARHPVHVTLRAGARRPYLRAEAVFRVVRGAIAEASRDAFRIVHFSVQPDHLHLIVEASDKAALSSGVRGLAIRVARRVNRLVRRRGSLWGDRWHGRDLKTPREVRAALVYVLANFKKHCPWEQAWVDPCSSAAWFDGWRDGPFAGPPEPRACVWAPRTWLAGVGWRRGGARLSIRESPGGGKAARARRFDSRPGGGEAARARRFDSRRAEP
jgi:REP-associated tyrosine transposase